MLIERAQIAAADRTMTPAIEDDQRERRRRFDREFEDSAPSELDHQRRHLLAREQRNQVGSQVIHPRLEIGRSELVYRAGAALQTLVTSRRHKLDPRETNGKRGEKGQAMSATIKADICVIGAGSAGLSVAAGTAQLGLRTLLIEAGEMGGDCLPFFAVSVLAILVRRSCDTEDAARILGATRWHVLTEITLPMIAPALSSAALISFAFNVGAFEVPLLRGPGYPRTLPVIAWELMSDPDHARQLEAMAVVILMAGIVVFASAANLLLLRRFTTSGARDD